MQQAMPAFQKRSALDVVLRQRVGNIRILSIMTLCRHNTVVTNESGTAHIVSANVLTYGN